MESRPDAKLKRTFHLLRSPDISCATDIGKDSVLRKAEFPDIVAIIILEH